jgi:HPt (histidine-containing phosphotransfer) domain-containing protein
MLTTRDLSELPTFRVHAEKLDQIGEHLCQMGLARRAEYPWYDVESQLASIFMASLAGLLSKIPEFNARPITDQQSEIALFESSESTRSSILASLLPAPSDEITAAHLAHFKSKHARLLRGFRNTIESFLLQLGAVSQPDLKSEMIEHFIQSAQEEINTIVDAMQTQGWKRITKGKFLSYTAAGATLANAIASGGILGIIAAAFGVANAAYKTIQGTKVPDAFQGSFVAYAAVAQTL